MEGLNELLVTSEKLSSIAGSYGGASKNLIRGVSFISIISVQKICHTFFNQLHLN